MEEQGQIPVRPQAHIAGTAARRYSLFCSSFLSQTVLLAVSSSRPPLLFAECLRVPQAACRRRGGVSNPKQRSKASDRGVSRTACPYGDGLFHRRENKEMRCSNCGGTKILRQESPNKVEWWCEECGECIGSVHGDPVGAPGEPGDAPAKQSNRKSVPQKSSTYNKERTMPRGKARKYRRQKKIKGASKCGT